MTNRALFGALSECPEEHEMTDNATAFAEYVAEIQKLAESAGATDPGKPYCDAEAWEFAYYDGLTPAEAWDEEVSAAASMIG